MNYEQALQYISSTYKFGTKAGLSNITKLTELLGNPQDSFKIIHIAGTNGKGSTSSMIHDALVCCGYKVGLFISPFLEEFTERIQINRHQISKDDLARITTTVKDKIELMVSQGYNHPTEFEVITAIGFMYFKEQNIDFLVLEVGLGGRFDATNVVKNTLVSVITSISLDHTEYLGDTVEKIAFEKAGIVKENSNVVIYPQSKDITDTIINQAKLKNSKYYIANKDNIRLIDRNIDYQSVEYLKKDILDLDIIKLKLLGEHQVYNCLTAITALEVIKSMGYNITSEGVKKGLSNCVFTGRFEIVHKNPYIVLDGGHNQNGVEYFSRAVKQYFDGRKIILFFGMLKDKHPENVLEYLTDVSKTIYTLTPDSPRAMSCKDLKALIDSKSSDVEVIALDSYEEALNIVKKADKDECIAFAGSLYLIGEIRTMLSANGYIDR